MSAFNKSLLYTATGKYLNIDQKDMAAILRYDDVKWGFEVSEGERPADPIVPHKATPTMRIIKDSSLMRRPIVIPLETIISALPVMSQSFYQSGLAVVSGSAPVPVSGETTANSLAAGEVALGMGHDAATLLKAPIDDQVEAYGKINLAAIIANGGTAVSDRYHLYDYQGAGYEDEVVRYDESGTAIDANSLFVRGANIPIGVVTEDIFIDDIGSSLNFTTNKFQKFSSFLTDWYVEVPYVVKGYNLAALKDNTTDGTVGGDWYATAGAAYKAIQALGMPVMWTDTLANLQVGLGKFVKPDFNGKYVLDNSATNKTIQHVGRLTSIDNKFPKDLEDLVMVVPDTKVGGTDTYGLPFRLFLLAWTILKNTGVSIPTFAQIVGLVNDGYVGMARINLHVS